jgi:hypothetical protein
MPKRSMTKRQTALLHPMIRRRASIR